MYKISLEERKLQCIKISEPILIDEILNNYSHIIDDYIVTPNINIHYIDGIKINLIQSSCNISIFNDLFEAIDHINFLSKTHFFYLFSINKTKDKRVIVRYIDIPLSYKIIGKENIRLQRLRDSKIEKILTI